MTPFSAYCCFSSKFLIAKSAYNAGLRDAIKHGKWIWDEAYEMFTCSNCGNQAVRNDYPYCMWCGAKMGDTE